VNQTHLVAGEEQHRLFQERQSALIFYRELVSPTRKDLAAGQPNVLDSQIADLLRSLSVPGDDFFRQANCFGNVAKTDAERHCDCGEVPAVLGFPHAQSSGSQVDTPCMHA